MNVFLISKVFVDLIILISFWNIVNVTCATYRKCYPPTSGKNCTTSVENDAILVNCSNLNLHICIPFDLNPDLTELDLSYNTYENIDELMLKRYRKLKILKMRHMDRVRDPSFSMYAFKYIYSVEVLDIANFSRDEFQRFPEFYWPPNIRELDISLNPYWEFVGDHVKLLQKLVARGLMNMRKFPKLHSNTPLRYIDITDTPINDLAVESIAPFCQLDYLIVNSNLFPSQSYCQCKRLDLWMKNYNLRQNTSLNCVPEDPPSPCNLHFNESVVSERRSCFEIVVSQETSSHWVLVVPLVLFILFSLLVPSYLYVKHFREAHHKLRKKHKTSTTTIPQSGEISETSEQESSSSVESDDSAEYVQPSE